MEHFAFKTLLTTLMNPLLIGIKNLNHRLGEEWRAIVHAPQHMPKTILEALLLHNLHIKIAHLVLIFNLILVLHVPPTPPRPTPPKKYLIITHFKIAFLLLSKLF